ncbi:MAG TPA: asparagine synthase-related protein [Thermoplasmata archaeon]|nr:asparagine synthase-related protein [Thermoplasmata archaeon]
MDGPEETTWFESLDRAFDRALARCVRGAPAVSVLFSGGVDSALVATGVRDLATVRLVTVGTEGSRDIGWARTAAQRLGLAVGVVKVAEADVVGVQERIAVRLAGLGGLRRSVQVSLALALSHAADPVALAGQGADELFGGYAHFRGLAGRELSERRRIDWERLRREDWPVSQRLAADLGRELRSPFLDDEFAQAALDVPLEPVSGTDLTKPRLRRWARHRGLPAEITVRPKLAMQYGSGVARALGRARRTAAVRGPDRAT